MRRDVLRLDVNGVVGRAIQKAASHAAFAPVASQVMPRLDRVVSRLTKGHFVPSQLLVPALVLTTTGAKSGLQRSTPLATLPEGDGVWYVVGSNFGGTSHPGWSANLRTTPSGTVTFRGKTYDVDAHLLDDDERAAVWPKLRAVWPTYDRYIEMAGGRELRVFRLTRRIRGQV